MSLHTYKDPHEVSAALARWITEDIQTALKTQDRFTFTLTGGNSPKEMYRILSKAEVDWKRIHIFWGDERAVPFTDDRNNAKMTYANLIDHIRIPAENVHVMQTDLGPEPAAQAYETLLRTFFGEEGPTFDLVLSGMGEDGHTLSLFPGQPVIHEKKAWVKAYFLEAQDMYRITMTAPLVNRAKRIAFLAFGDNKAHALHEVLQGRRNVDLYPSQIIRSDAHWFVDQAAAKEL